MSLSPSKDLKQFSLDEISIPIKENGENIELMVSNFDPISADTILQTPENRMPPCCAVCSCSVKPLFTKSHRHDGLCNTHMSIVSDLRDSYFSYSFGAGMGVIVALLTIPLYDFMMNFCGIVEITLILYDLYHILSRSRYRRKLLPALELQISAIPDLEVTWISHNKCWLSFFQEYSRLPPSATDIIPSRHDKLVSRINRYSTKIQFILCFCTPFHIAIFGSKIWDQYSSSIPIMLSFIFIWGFIPHIVRGFFDRSTKPNLWERIEDKKTLEGIVEKDSNDVLAWFYLGHAYLKLNEISKAEQAFRRVIGFAPQFSPAWNGLGLILDGDDAINALRHGLKLNPNNPELWANLGHELWVKEEFLYAEMAYRNVLTLNPSDEWVQLCLIEVEQRRKWDPEHPIKIIVKEQESILK